MSFYFTILIVYRVVILDLGYLKSLALPTVRILLLDKLILKQSYNCSSNVCPIKILVTKLIFNAQLIQPT